MTGDSITAYDLPARVVSYDADMEVMHPNRSKMIEIALEIPPEDPESRITALELGCGTGFFTKAFLERYPCSRVIAIDGAFSMIDLARVRLGTLVERVDFRIGDFRELSRIVANDERGSIVFSSYSLHHLNRTEKGHTIRQALEFLEPGGWFLNADLIVNESPTVEQRIQGIRVEQIVRRSGGTDPRFRNFESTRQFLDQLEADDGDQPLSLSEDLQILRAGLQNVSVFWTEYREAVFGGQKPSRS